MKNRSTQAQIVLLAAVFIWGSSFLITKSILQWISPLLLNQLRMTIAFALLSVIYARSWKLLTRTMVWRCALVGLLLTGGFELQTSGLVYTTPSNSAFLTGLVVLIVPLLLLLPPLRALRTRKFGLKALIGSGLAMAGIALLTAHGNTPLANMNQGDVLSLLCAFVFASHLLTLTWAAKAVPPQLLNTLQLGFAALYMAVATPLLEHPHIAWRPQVVGGVLFCATFCTAFAFGAQSWAVQFLKPNHTALLLAMEPVFAWVLAVASRYEKPTLRSSGGALCILAGIVITEWIDTPESTA